VESLTTGEIVRGRDVDESATGVGFRIAAAALGVLGALAAAATGLVAVSGGRIVVALGPIQGWVDVGPVSPSFGWLGIAASLISVVGVVVLIWRPRVAGILLLVAGAAAGFSSLSFSLSIVALTLAGILAFVSTLAAGSKESQPDPFWDQAEDD
jgi:hypothetical protein